MAASMWRMNGLCRSMSGVLLLCALLFSSKVTCQDDPSTPSPSGSADMVKGTTVRNPVTDSLTGKALSDEPSVDSSAVAFTLAAVPATSKPLEDNTFENTSEPLVVTTLPSKPVQPVEMRPSQVACVGKGDIPEEKAVKIQLTETKPCEEIKGILEDFSTQWCKPGNCNLNIFQDDSTVLMELNGAEKSSLEKTLYSEALKDRLGVAENSSPSSSSSSSVFVGILVTGLLAALGLIVGYYKCQRRPETKGAKLAEEAYPVDQENQGNTLASEAPLNPPPETQEKPSINGESPEAVKIETPPPTNGHSTAKTADTEL
ncbi:PREDICTED: uncharacterized protein LOC107092075 [Cyprinodon variegatus]|uniref:uncharacterized protein LOC107092075 n=1 Tax=Cyprinodon variegatus TaxID=28743 RepID=UPI000742BA05|nr:PREDICTED: uncharacterized protein LOC107092075 [Cyprinodon variegatus]